MNTEPTCAVCGRIVTPDLDHVEVTAERVNMDDRNREHTYYLHNQCWYAVGDSWRPPA
jgi:hypothetical protein